MRSKAHLSLLLSGWTTLVTACTVGVTTVEVQPDEEDPPPTEPVLHSILAGSFAPLAGYTGISGRAQVVRSLDDTTTVDVQVVGLAPSTTYVAHVHAQPCEYSGGGHYLIDPTVVEVVEENELWLQVATSPTGVGSTVEAYSHFARGDALSIVVHDSAAANAKMACADLAVDDSTDVELTGSVAPFALAAAGDMTISGAAVATRSSSATHVELMLDGLDPGVLYGTHVHALPCNVGDAGGHYKIDPTVVDALETNEIWLSVMNYPDGSMVSEIDLDHSIRADAQSIVLHRHEADETKPKVACANLTRSYPGLDTSGGETLLADGISRLPDLTASASMERSLAGWTRVTLDVSGLDADTDYKAHVHNLPCSVESGGGHYMINPDEAADLETNEMWLTLSADGAGAASDSMWVSHIGRTDAQSVVIHDPADKARLACVDLD